MIKLENYEVVGWEHAIRGMRNPMNSWEKSDSGIGCLERHYHCSEEVGHKLCKNCSATYDSHCFCAARDGGPKFVIGPNDHDLMMRLAKAGPVHAKYRRMIEVYVDITAPLYWWKEFDTYKVGTVANSCSTMHKILEKEFTMDDFSHEQLWPFDGDGELNKELLFNIKHSDARSSGELLQQTIAALNWWRNKYIETKNKPMKEEAKRKPLLKKIWWQIIQLLPSSYNQKRTIMFPYEVLANVYEYRQNHKMDEGHWDVIIDWIESLPYSEIITGEECTDA